MAAAEVKTFKESKVPTGKYICNLKLKEGRLVTYEGVIDQENLKFGDHAFNNLRINAPNVVFQYYANQPVLFRLTTNRKNQLMFCSLEQDKRSLSMDKDGKVTVKDNRLDNAPIGNAFANTRKLMNMNTVFEKMTMSVMPPEEVEEKKED